MITPAKWQAKNAGQNEKFRRNLVPHMRKVVYYPEAQEIFDIRNLDGIQYYLIDKDIHREIEIVNIQKKVKAFNNTLTRPLKGQLNNTSLRIIEKIQESCKNTIQDSLNFRDLLEVKRYKVIILGMNGNCYYDNDGKTIGMNKQYIVEDTSEYSKDYEILFQSDSLDEVASFKSYINLRLIKFIQVTSLVGQRCDNSETWRFIPDPGKLDHIFTDQEIYSRYSLTDDEVRLVESVIKDKN